MQLRRGFGLGRHLGRRAGLRQVGQRFGLGDLGLNPPRRHSQLGRSQRLENHRFGHVGFRRGRRRWRLLKFARDYWLELRLWLRRLARRERGDGKHLRLFLLNPVRGSSPEKALVPAGDAAQALYPAIRPAAAREVMRLLGKADHLDGFAQEPHGTEQLFRLRDGAAQIHLATRQEQRSANVPHVADGRALPQLIGVGIRRGTQLQPAPQHDVVLSVFADQVRDRAHRNSS